MASGQRAFAQKLSKRGAAEVRRQVSAASLIGLPQSISRINLNTQPVPLDNVVEPPDFEQLLSEQDIASERDPLRRLLEYPRDDISVEVLRRKVRTVTSVVPEQVCGSHIQDCLAVYTSDYTVVKHRYEGLVNRHVNCPPVECSEGDHLYELDYEQTSIDDQCSIGTLDDDEGTGGGEWGEETPRGSWASSIFDLRKSQADALLPELLDDPGGESRPVGEVPRLGALHREYPPQKPEELVERRTPAEVPTTRFGQRILIKCLQLSLELDVEPIFASLALYDAHERRKLSENFHFDLTAERLKRLLVAHVPYQDVSSLSRSCIFSLSHHSPDIFLVIKLEKVLQPGDISEVAEPYMKDDKNKQKAQQNVEYDCARLGQYRMPFAWTAVHLTRVLSGDSQPDNLDQRASGISQFEGFWRKPPLSRDDSFNRSGTLTRQRPTSEKRDSAVSLDDMSAIALGNFAPVTLTISTFFKQEAERLSDEELYKSLLDLQRPTSALKRFKVIPGVLKLSVAPYMDEQPYCLTPELYRIHPYPDDKCRPTKEVIEFPAKPVLEPYTSYRNLLYVYPKSVNFTSRQGSARNIAVKIQLMNGEEPQNALIVIFGKSSCPEFSREAFASVTYHNKSPTFYEEVKMRLPAELTDSHHLLFTFYHVACQRGKSEPAAPPQTPIGYTWLPLLRDNRLTTGQFGLPISLDPLPGSYSVLHPDVQLPSMKWVDAHKPLFVVTLHTVSSVHTQDVHVDRFLSVARAASENAPIAPAPGSPPHRTAPRPSENELKLGIGGLGQADGTALVHFLPLVLNRLLALIVQPPVISGQVANVAQSSFEMMAEIVQRVQSMTSDLNDQHGHNALLRSYIHYSSQITQPASQGPPPGTVIGGGYSTLGRRPPQTGATSLADSKLNARSSSDPDLPSSPPRTPDWETVNLLGMRAGERSSQFAPEPQVHMRTPGCKLVHEEIALQWVVSSGTYKELTLTNAWFFFELIIKGMAEHLARSGKLNAPRKSRFPSHFIDDIVALVSMLTKDIVDRYNQNYALIRNVNMSVAFFLRDSLSWLDRGLIFRLIKHYCQSVAQRVSSTGASDTATTTSLRCLRLDLLRVVCSHEHYVSLSLQFSPLVSPPSPTPSVASITTTSSAGTPPGGGGERCTELTDEYRTRHFLCALVLSELAIDSHQPEPSVTRQAISTVCSLLFSHDSDPRYEPPDVRARVTMMYLPVLTIAAQYLPYLYDPASVNNRGEQMVAPPSAECGIDVAHAISGDVGQNDYHTVGGKVGEESTRKLLVCVLWTVKHCERHILFNIWSELSQSQLHAVLRLLHLALSNFEYTGAKSECTYSQHTKQKSVDMKTKLVDAILGNLSARSELMSRRQQQTTQQAGSTDSLAMSSDSPRLRWQKDQTHWRQASEIADTSSLSNRTEKPDKPPGQLIGGALATELSLIVVDMLELIVQIVQQSESLQGILGGVLQVLLHGLSLNQSTVVLNDMFVIQRSLITKFPELLFEEEPQQCSDLCLQLLRHCGSAISGTRAQASGSLYLLMRQNFEIGNNFARVKMQVTMCLSWLVGHDCSEGQLRRSLKTILTYAEADSDLHDTSFPEQVRDLVFNLHMILSDTVKMKEYEQDPEMLMDLMYRIAKGYQNSPDLRLTWLQNMAGKHSMRDRHAESAQCLVHAAGLVAEYLNMLEDKPYLPVGCAAFHGISSNVLEESAVSDDVLTPDGGTICAGTYFSEAGLLGLLEQAAGCLDMAGMPEVVNSIYKILIPIHEANRDFKKLSIIHGRLHDAFNTVLKQEGKRIFGTYFRVGFYGNRFGDLDNEEYIYKEPAITKLPEISHRLEHFYTDQLGPDVVEMIKDSNTVDREKLDPLRAYIQITYVEPHFELYEQRDRKTCFERNYNIKRFMYATPFTEDGRRAHGQLHEQYKRKTILTTSHAFPYVKTRLQVTHRQQFVLSPIEVAIEDIRKKTKELATALYQDHPDPKMLQMVLQGCIGTTVNQGPVEIAMVFLAPLADGQVTLTKHHSKLRVSFRDFMKKGIDALHKNKTLISADQYEYQRELERNYVSIKEKLAPFISMATNPSATATKKKHKRDRGDQSKKAKFAVISNTGSSSSYA